MFQRVSTNVGLTVAKYEGNQNTYYLWVGIKSRLQEWPREAGDHWTLKASKAGHSVHGRGAGLRVLYYNNWATFGDVSNGGSLLPFPSFPSLPFLFPQDSKNRGFGRISEIRISIVVEAPPETPAATKSMHAYTHSPEIGW